MAERNTRPDVPIVPARYAQRVNNPIAVSSWALHRTIGISYPDSPAVPRKPGAVGTVHGSDPMPLEDLPAALAAHGYSMMQLCHFHLPDRSPAYLEDFRSALDGAGVKLHALLIDDGDITDPDHWRRDMDWIASWLETAQALGAQNARVIAGKQTSTPERLTASVERLAALAGGTSVRVQIENWFELTATPGAVNELLNRLEGRVGLCADFGNWPRPRKYEDLPQIMGRAESCHAKFEFVTPTEIDRADADACLTIARRADYAGPFVLVSGGTGESDWDGLAVQKEACR